MAADREASGEGPVFIIGCPRSGTSWTWGLLHDLPCFEPLLIEDFPGLAGATGIERMQESDGLYRTTETTVFFSDLDDEVIVRAVEEKQARNAGKLLLEKTPSHVEKIERIMRLFPKARFIHLLRDPRATVNSLVQTEFPNGFRFASDLDGAIAFLRRHYEAAKPHLDDPRMLLLRYEALHDDPEAALRQLLHDAGWLHRVDPADLTRAVEANRGRTKSRQGRLFRRGTVDSWRGELGPDAVHRIEEDLADVFATFGYRRRTLWERLFRR